MRQQQWKPDHNVHWRGGEEVEVVAIDSPWCNNCYAYRNIFSHKVVFSFHENVIYFENRTEKSLSRNVILHFIS